MKLHAIVTDCKRYDRLLWWLHSLSLLVDWSHIIHQLIDMSLVYSLSFSFSHTLSTVSRYYHATVPPDVVSMSAINDQMSAMVGDRMLAGQHLVRHCLKHFFVLDVGLNCGVLCGHG